MLGKVKGDIGMRAPEDKSKIFRGPQGFNTDLAKDEDIDTYHRYERIVANDQENIPCALVVAYASINYCTPIWYNCAMISFTTARLMHT